jgi:hypothetical protein
MLTTQMLATQMLATQMLATQLLATPMVASQPPEERQRHHHQPPAARRAHPPGHPSGPGRQPLARAIRPERPAPPRPQVAPRPCGLRLRSWRLRGLRVERHVGGALRVRNTLQHVERRRVFRHFAGGRLQLGHRPARLEPLARLRRPAVDEERESEQGGSRDHGPQQRARRAPRARRFGGGALCQRRDHAVRYIDARCLGRKRRAQGVHALLVTPHLLAQRRIDARFGEQPFGVAFAEPAIDPVGQPLVDARQVVVLVVPAHERNPPSLCCRITRPRWMRDRTVPIGRSSA